MTTTIGGHTGAVEDRFGTFPTARPQRRVAIIGAGTIAAVHRDSALRAGARVVGVMASTPERSAAVADQWGVDRGYSSIEEVVDGGAEVVHVASPNATHAAYVTALLEAGKHVICEKPLGISGEQADAMTAAAGRAGVVATVPFVYRYHPVVREIRSRLAAGDIGELNLLHGSYLQDWMLAADASNWRVDARTGGPSRAFADIGSHWCDLVEWVTGLPLTSLVAQLSTAVAERPTGTEAALPGTHTTAVDTEDAATVMFRTASGAPGSVVVSQVAAGRKNRLWFELDGSAGSVVFDQENPESFWLGTAEGSRTIVRDPTRGSAEQRRLSRLPAGHPQGYADCFAAFVADTYAAVDGRSPDGLPLFSDGARSARIVDAVLESARLGAWTTV